MDENRNNNMKRKEKYKIRKTIYILLIIIIVLNVLFISHGDGHYIPENINSSNINDNQISEHNRNNVLKEPVMINNPKENNDERKKEKVNIISKNKDENSRPNLKF